MSRLSEVVRWREGTALIHADGADGQGSTLCGRALEGDGEGESGEELVEVHRGKIVCRHCIAIIEAAKQIPKKLYARSSHV